MDDVPVARDIGSDDRRARRERLGQHHAEAFAAQRRRTEEIGVRKLPALGGLVNLAERAHAAAIKQQRLELFWRGPDQGQLARKVFAQRLEGAQQHREALALHGLTDEYDLQLVADRPRRRGERYIPVDVYAIRNQPVVAAEEALVGPGGRL